MIPRKLYDRMVDLELEVLKAVDEGDLDKVGRLDDELTRFQEEVRLALQGESRTTRRLELSEETVNREECRFNRNDTAYQQPCYRCGLNVPRHLREDCPFARKVDEVERVRAEGKSKARVILERLNAYREGIGEALKDVRKYRSTGEPARSDREEIRELVRRLKGGSSGRGKV